MLRSQNKIKVLGVNFDSKLNWQFHIQSAITKAKKALQAIKLIKKHFNKNELMTLLIANYYSVLFYNSEIWLLPSLTRPIKQILLSASAAPLKMYCHTYHSLMSYETLHYVSKHPTPNDYTKYNHALLLYKTHNNTNQTSDWLDLNFNQNFNTRCHKANFIETSRFKPGKNLISNRITIINNQIEYKWLNLPLLAFKNKCKNIFLSKS